MLCEKIEFIIMATPTNISSDLFARISKLITFETTAPTHPTPTSAVLEAPSSCQVIEEVESDIAEQTPQVQHSQANQEVCVIQQQVRELMKEEEEFQRHELQQKELCQGMHGMLAMLERFANKMDNKTGQDRSNYRTDMEVDDRLEESLGRKGLVSTAVDRWTETLGRGYHETEGDNEPGNPTDDDTSVVSLANVPGLCMRKQDRQNVEEVMKGISYSIDFEDERASLETSNRHISNTQEWSSSGISMKLLQKLISQNAVARDVSRAAS
eukprot:GHVQ01040592.1.p2 GENE.GHVQ01040592.1~~GHVQ01040592.1.p2  ORF type:complete len:269 (-),score=45.29 GHVQ01040592.1:1888-2694(-)